MATTVMTIRVLRTNTFNTSELALLFTPVFASAFNSRKNMVDGLIFIFGMHPFDVGDRVDTDKMQGMSFIQTPFWLAKPSATSAALRISLITLDFSLDAETPPEDIADIENRILNYLKDNKKYSIYVEEECYTHKKYSKVLIEELGQKQIKMALHLKNPLQSSPEKEQHK
ncbi:hypothetical protein Ancab_000868, partial [Ancistrocladus abbreviatus]